MTSQCRGTFGSAATVSQTPPEQCNEVRPCAAPELIRTLTALSSLCLPHLTAATVPAALLQRRDMITKHQIALHSIRYSTVLPNYVSLNLLLRCLPQVSAAGGTLLEVHVGPRELWKDAQHPLRCDPVLACTSIPTVLEWRDGKPAQRLDRELEETRAAADPAGSTAALVQDFVDGCVAA